MGLLVVSIRVVFLVVLLHIWSLLHSPNADNKQNKQAVCATRLNFTQKFHWAGHWNMPINPVLWKQKDYELEVCQTYMTVSL